LCIRYWDSKAKKEYGCMKTSGEYQLDDVLSPRRVWCCWCWCWWCSSWTAPHPPLVLTTMCSITVWWWWWLLSVCVCVCGEGSGLILALTYRHFMAQMCLLAAWYNPATAALFCLVRAQYTPTLIPLCVCIYIYIIIYIIIIFFLLECTSIVCPFIYCELYGCCLI